MHPNIADYMVGRRITTSVWLLKGLHTSEGGYDENRFL
jgi:hypothetical protein